MKYDIYTIVLHGLMIILPFNWFELGFSTLSHVICTLFFIQKWLIYDGLTSSQVNQILSDAYYLPYFVLFQFYLKKALIVCEFRVQNCTLSHGNRTELF